MLISSTSISQRKTEGTRYLSNITYNRLVRDIYSTHQPPLQTAHYKLLLLLEALNSWSNLEGASNILSSQQLMSVMDNIAKQKRDCDVKSPMSVDSSVYKATKSCGFTLSIQDTTTVDLSLNNNILSATVKVSASAGNNLTKLGDGLYVASSGSGAETLYKVHVTMTDPSSASYTNAVFTGKSLLLIAREGLTLKDTDVSLVGDTITFLNGDTFNPGVWYTFILKGTTSTAFKIHIEYAGAESATYSNAQFIGQTLLTAVREGLTLNDATISLTGDTITFLNGDKFQPGTWYTFILKS